MAIKWISDAWKTDLKTQCPPMDRIYIGFRQKEYPAIDDDFTYTLVTSGDNQPGSYNLTGGHGDYILPLADTISFAIKILPTFAYDVATDQDLLNWYIDATHRLRLFYCAADDMFTLSWQDGGTERVLKSDAYVSDETLQVWAEIACSIDLTTGDTTGGALYIDRAAVDTVWSGNIDARSTEMPLMSLRHQNATEGGYTINYLRVFLDDAVAAADIANNFSDIKTEELYWHFNGESVGRDRTNITRFVTGITHTKEVEKENGSQAANTLIVNLKSQYGEFADDQYAAWDPANDIFNGTSSQKYMQQRCGIIAETWYSNNFEPYFVGKIDGDLFRRTTIIDDISRVTISADDLIVNIASFNVANGSYWEDKKISDATEANSLIHLISRLATQIKTYNYASNTSFENATIANSWIVAGAGATFSRVAGGLFGSYQGDLVYGAALCTVTQTITFTSIKYLNVGESYTFQIWLKSAGACTPTIEIAEHDAGGVNDNSTTETSIAGGEGWLNFSVTHTITDSDSDRLLIVVTLEENVTLSMDGAHLLQGNRAINWFVLNDNDGSSGTESADDADYDSYDTVGFDCDAVDITHPWAIVDPNTTPWDYINDIADATIAMYLGMSADGTLTYRSKLVAGYSDPTPIETIDRLMQIDTKLELPEANKIIIHGVDIVKQTTLKVLWSIRATERLGSELVLEEILNGESWPECSDADLDPYWATYSLYDYEAEGTAVKAQLWNSILNGWYRWYWYRFHKYKENNNAESIIGAKSITLTQLSADAAFVGQNDLTVTTFDSTTRPGAALIKLTNSTGNSRWLLDLYIKGTPVLRFSGDSGYIHDSFINQESIYRNGEKAFELGNNFVCTKAQVNKLADYWWKEVGTKKHIYSCSQSGMWLWYEPGEWYTLDIGAAGTAENIDSTVECRRVSYERRVNEIGTTIVEFKEIEANWTFDSNAVARYLARGKSSSLESLGTVIVASSTYSGEAHYYCDGTADQVQIQAAIDWLQGAYGGGKVHLTEGTFIITAAIEGRSNIAIDMQAGTILEKNCNDYAIESVGSDGSEQINFIIRGGKITRNAADTNSVSTIYLYYSDNVIIDEVIIEDSYYKSIDIQYCDGIKIGNVLIITPYYYAFWISHCSGLIADSFINGKSTARNADECIEIEYSDRFQLDHISIRDYYPQGADANTGIIKSSNSDKVQITNCVFQNIIATPAVSIWYAAIFAYGDKINMINNQIYSIIGLEGNAAGIFVGGDDDIINNNLIEDCYSAGIYINAGNRNIISNNDCYNNKNLIQYNNCESVNPPNIRLDGSSVSNCTFARDATEQHWGDYSYKQTITATGTDAEARQCDNATTTDMHELIAGQTYKYSGYVFVPSTGGCAAAEAEIVFAYYDSAAWTEDSTAATGQDAWELVETAEVTIPATATGTRVFLRIQDTASNGEFCYWDDLWLQPIGIENEHDNNFYDGGTETQLSGNSWQGVQV